MHERRTVAHRHNKHIRTHKYIHLYIHHTHKHYVDRMRNWWMLKASYLEKWPTPITDAPSTIRFEKTIVRSYVIREVVILQGKKATTRADSTLLLSGVQRTGLLVSSEEISTPLQFVADGSYEKNACSVMGWTTNDTLRMPTLTSYFWYIVSKWVC